MHGVFSSFLVTRYHLSRGSGHSFRVRAGRGRRVRLALSPGAGMRVRPWPSRCRRSSPQRRSRPEPHRRHAACIARHRAEARTAYDVGRRDPMVTLLQAPPSTRAADRCFRAAVRLSLFTIAQVPMRSDGIVLVSAGARGNAQNARRCPLPHLPLRRPAGATCVKSDARQRRLARPPTPIGDVLC